HRKGDIPCVDCDQQRRTNLVFSIVIRINPALGWNQYPIYFAVIGSIVDDTSPAHDVYSVFVPAQEAVIAKVRRLHARVGRNMLGKGYLQDAPALAVFVPGSYLFGPKTRPGV